MKFFSLDFTLFFRLLLTFKPLFIYKKTCHLWNYHFILKNEEISPSDLNLNHLFSWSSKRFKCLSRYQKTKKNRKKMPFFWFFFMFLANCCLLMASLTFSLISGIILVFFLVLGMILIPSWVSSNRGAHNRALYGNNGQLT